MNGHELNKYYSEIALIHDDQVEADNNLSRGAIEQKLRMRFDELWRFPVGGDELLSRAAEAMIGILDTRPDLVDAVYEARVSRAQKGISLPTISAALMLASHIINYILFQQGQHDFPQKMGLNDDDRARGVEAYRSLLLELIQNQFESYTRPLFERNIQSTDPLRGAGFPAVIHMLNVKNWVDIGSSTGFPVKRAAYPTPELRVLDPWHVEDQTPGSVINRYLDVPHELQSLTAVDPVDPFADRDAIDWFVACRMPKAVTPEAVQHTRAQIQTYRNGINFPGYSFKLGSTSDIGLPQGMYDLVTASTVMTHIDPYQRDQSIQNMLQLLDPSNPKSMVVIQDYARRSAEFGYGIEIVPTREPFQYGIWMCGAGTEYMFKQFVQFQNSSCRGHVRAGDDFDLLMHVMHS